MKNLKRWWANQCAQSATGLHLADLVNQYQQISRQNRELLTENRRLANAHRAIIAQHHFLHENMADWERMTHFDYATSAAALGINNGRAEAANAPITKKTLVAEVAESARQAVSTGTAPQAYYRSQYWLKRWTGSPENIKGSMREYRATQRKAKKLNA